MQEGVHCHSSRTQTRNVNEILNIEYLYEILSNVTNSIDTYRVAYRLLPE